MTPFYFFKLGIKSLLKNQNIYLFYMHPWEVDPQQPKVFEASFLYKFRHYLNLKKTYVKLAKLIEHFRYCRFLTCAQYLNEIANLGLKAGMYDSEEKIGLGLLVRDIIWFFMCIQIMRFDSRRFSLVRLFIRKPA